MNLKKLIYGFLPRVACWLVGHKYKTIYFTTWDFSVEKTEITWKANQCNRCLKQKNLTMISKSMPTSFVRIVDHNFWDLLAK